MLSLKDVNELLDKIPKWKRIQESPDRLDELEKRIKAIEDRISGTGEVCPYCKEPALELLEIKPDPEYGDMGVKRAYYKCGKCEKLSDRQKPLKS